jgi:hypothetical protein
VDDIVDGAGDGGEIDDDALVFAEGRGGEERGVVEVNVGEG